MQPDKIMDCAIIGGGPAGLGSALVLGRSRRNVLLFDDATNRNQVTHESHGFLTRDGTTPSELRRLGREDVAAYPSVTIVDQKVSSIIPAKNDSFFTVTTSDDQTYYVKKLILAVGFKESLPSIEGIHHFYGKSVFNCPYCDGWELRDQPLIIINDTEHASHMAKVLYNWSKDLVLATNGSEFIIEPDVRQRLEAKGIRINTKKIVQLSGENGQLSSVTFEDGTKLHRSGGFVAPTFIFNPLREQMNFELTEHGALIIDDFGRTSIKNIYAAGDAISPAYSQLIVSAASGHKTGIGVNSDLTEELFA
ncbi:NAD(P)/FAD-dependent oxidoreductase [Alkalicoccobacillus gibsonii]|uniref:NAD(P)/FAD-dependent oxidoreductase n=1 Tax=Alkalicoccobacillus gibsonii TaxID=79881 RepID=UPI003F7C56DD